MRHGSKRGDIAVCRGPAAQPEPALALRRRLHETEST